MTSNILLFAFIMSIFGLTLYCLYTNDVTEEERDEMLNDEEMWP